VVSQIPKQVLRAGHRFGGDDVCFISFFNAFRADQAIQRSVADPAVFCPRLATFVRIFAGCQDDEAAAIGSVNVANAAVKLVIFARRSL
jgi:hypothetical protein